MKEFDIQKALAGNRLVTRSGKEVINFKKRKKRGGDSNAPIKNYPFSAVIDGDTILTFNQDGKFCSYEDSHLDLFILEEDNTDSIVESKEEIIDSSVQDFCNITDSLVETYKKKNSDYGNSFEESLNEEGIIASRIRIGDKWNRFKNLSKGNNQLVKDESIKDTLLDMANYCILTVMWMNNKDKNK